MSQAKVIAILTVSSLIGSLFSSKKLCKAKHASITYGNFSKLINLLV